METETLSEAQLRLYEGPAVVFTPQPYCLLPSLSFSVVLLGARSPLSLSFSLTLPHTLLEKVRFSLPLSSPFAADEPQVLQEPNIIVGEPALLRLAYGGTIEAQGLQSLRMTDGECSQTASTKLVWQHPSLLLEQLLFGRKYGKLLFFLHGLLSSYEILKDFGPKYPTAFVCECVCECVCG